MLAAFSEINWIGVLAGTAVFSLLGAAYFLVLAPKQYLYATGRENLPKEEQGVTGAIFIVGPMLCSLLNVIADAYFVHALGIETLSDAATLGVIVGLGFLVPMTFNIAINPLFPRPIHYGLLNTPYFLVANVIACVLLVIITW